MSSIKPLTSSRKTGGRLIESRDLAPVGVGVPGDGRKDVDLGEIVVPEGAKLRARIRNSGIPGIWKVKM